MRLAQSIAVALLLGGTPIVQLVQANEPVQLAQSIWKPFSSKEGRFSVLMPGTPREFQVSYDTLTGEIMYLFDVKRDDAVYTVGYADVLPLPERPPCVPGQLTTPCGPPRLPNTPEKMTFILTKGAMDLGGFTQSGDIRLVDSARLVSQRTVSLGRYLGKEVSLQLPSGVTSRRRMYVVNRRVYILTVTTTKERYLSKTIDGFMNSFRLLSQ